MIEAFEDFFESDPSLLAEYRWPNNPKGRNREDTIKYKLKKSEEWRRSDRNEKIKI